MGWRRGSNVYGIKIQSKRKHKGKVFFPEKRASTRTELYRYLISTKLAYTHYYRIYRHKGRGYTLYKGPPKATHGGIRHRPTTRRLRTRLKTKGYRIKKTKLIEPKPEEAPRPLFEVRRIKRGRHKGNLRTKKGKVLTPKQFRLFRSKNQSKYNFKVKE